MLQIPFFNVKLKQVTGIKKAPTIKRRSITGPLSFKPLTWMHLRQPRNYLLHLTVWFNLKLQGKELEKILSSNHSVSQLCEVRIWMKFRIIIGYCWYKSGGNQRPVGRPGRFLSSAR